MKQETMKKEETSVQAAGGPKCHPKSRSQAAYKARQEALARENPGGAPERGSGADKTGSRKSGDGKWIPPTSGLRKAALAVIILAAAAGVGGYVYRAVGYQNTYLPHTVINGMDVSNCTVDEVKDKMASGVRDYSLMLKLRGDKSESISGSSIGLHTAFDGSLDEIIRQQNPYLWPRYLLKGPSYDIQTMIVFDEAALDTAVEDLDCLKPENTVKPADAYLSDYISGQGYQVVPEEEGTVLNPASLRDAVAEGVQDLEKELDLDAQGCYEEPAVRADDSALAAARDARNRYVNMTVTYIFGNNREILDGDTINHWLLEDGGNVALDRDKIAEYIKELSARYNTAYKKRSFKTSYGQTVEVSGFYGWRINQTAEAEKLAEILETGESLTREPVYAQTAASHDGADYGSTYAEVNLTAQHMFFYKDGEKILESDFVSGSVAKGHTTPPGIFALTYKQKDAVLKGEGYASPVKYWMPFNGGIGFHDASWRSNFGGSIYKSGGSHGCVNMPYASAKELYENVYAGMPVICYNLPGTESNKASKSPQTAPAAVPQTTAAVVPTQAPSQETLPAEPQETLQETLPAEPQETTPSAPAEESSPSVTIDPVGQTTEAITPSADRPESTGGYGPGFQTTVSSDNIVPDVH